MYLLKMALQIYYASWTSRNLNWSFLLNILKQMNFGSKLKWIELCIKIVRFSVLLNGEPVGYFPSERGLRQGNLLAMEGFDSMMRIATQHRWIRGFHIGDKTRGWGGKDISTYYMQMILYHV